MLERELKVTAMSEEHREKLRELLSVVEASFEKASEEGWEWVLLRDLRTLRDTLRERLRGEEGERR